MFTSLRIMRAPNEGLGKVANEIFKRKTRKCFKLTGSYYQLCAANFVLLKFRGNQDFDF